jgi:hypothetical protein
MVIFFWAILLSPTGSSFGGRMGEPREHYSARIRMGWEQRPGVFLGLGGDEERMTGEDMLVCFMNMTRGVWAMIGGEALD